MVEKKRTFQEICDSLSTEDLVTLMHGFGLITDDLGRALMKKWLWEKHDD